MRNNIEINSTVKFQLGRNVKTTITGKVKRENFSFVYVQPERVAGKFAKSIQKENLICVHKNQLIA